MNRRIISLVAVIALTTAATLPWVGKAHGQASDASGEGVRMPERGAACQVYLRGDASGMAWHDRIPDVSNLITRKGTFVSADNNWLVLRDGNHQFYVPRSSILAFEVQK